MKIDIKNLKNAQVEVNIEMPWDEFSRYCDKATEQLSKNVNLKGFRPGKAPKDLVEKELGKERILAAATDIALKEKYPEIIKENHLEVIGSPAVEVSKLAWGNELVCKIKSDVLPDIDLPDYQSIAKTVEKEKVEVKEQEVADALEWLRKTRAKFEDLKTPAKKNDFIEIEYQSEQVEANKAFTDSFVLGKGRFVPGFEDNFIGLSTGDEKEFSVPFPKDYFKKDLAGKDVKFKAKVIKAQKMDLPELNNEFAKQAGKFKDLDELKKSIKQGIAQEKEIAMKEKWRQEVLSKISQKVDCPLPVSLVVLEQARITEEFKKNIKENLKMEFDDYLAEADKTEDELKKSFGQKAEQAVKNFLVLRAIGKKENIKLNEKDEQDIQQAIQNLLTSYPQEQKQKVNLEQLTDYYKGKLYDEKVFAKLESFA